MSKYNYKLLKRDTWGNKEWELQKRIKEEAELYVKKGETIRSVAEHFKLGKSQIERDLRSKIVRLDDDELIRKVRAKLSHNKDNAWKRGRKAYMLNCKKRKEMSENATSSHS